MISFDSFTLKKWLDENAEYMVGARIQKIQQPTRRDFVFSLRNKGETKKCYEEWMKNRPRNKINAYE